MNEKGGVYYKPLKVAILIKTPLRTVPTNSKVLFAQFINVREKQIWTSVIEIRNENWG